MLRSLIIAIIAFAAGFFAGQHLSPAPAIRVERDTLVVLRVDTLRVSRPLPPVTRTVVRVDTLHVTDTITLLPITQMEYADTAYRAWVSGYEPRLDSLHIMQPVQVAIPRRRRWSVAPSAGVALTPRGIQPYIGVGITFSLNK